MGDVVLLWQSILVRWEAPGQRWQHGALTGYKVRYRAARRKPASLTTPADTTRALLRADPNTQYQVHSSVSTVILTALFLSEWVTAATPRRPRHDAAAVPPRPPPLTTRAGRDWISVWWDTEKETEAEEAWGWVLGWGLGVPDTASRELPPGTHSHVIRGLKSNEEYVISLRGSNALGLGPAGYATVRTRPPPAHDAADDDDDVDDADDDDDDDERLVIMLSGTTAVVYWTDPTLPKGQTATDGRRYVVRWTTQGSRPHTYNATDLNCMIDELKPNTHYEFAVKLIRGGRESQWSMIVSNTSLEAPPASAPRDLRASPPPPPAPPSRYVELAWSPPAKPNGQITGYVVMYAIQRTGGGEEWAAVSVAGERGRARVERLRPRTSYLFKVQARNNKGLGPFCTPLVYTTPLESGEGGGLASATSAWLWASAGGACAVLALAAALALSLCCRRAPPLSPDTRCVVYM
ncbi:unnamed protein product [Diatraea saccharalis]|uniref:Fibronectin type-III domain-containing protein n=1 Tax=Diatraea saccharalis TaxID=40085 RepID=A0A9N9WK55_9NEOP|nr:unnamed protein product [Diatraea saccharalis]